MIAARMHRLARAFEAAQRPVQDGRAEFADFPWRRGITILTLAGKAVRRRLLTDLEHIDGESLGFAQDRAAARAVRATDEQHGRLERPRSETVRGQPPRCPVATNGRPERKPRRDTTPRSAQGTRQIGTAPAWTPFTYAN